jgi:hypothetical protein
VWAKLDGTQTHFFSADTGLAMAPGEALIMAHVRLHESFGDPSSGSLSMLVRQRTSPLVKPYAPVIT